MAVIKGPTSFAEGTVNGVTVGAPIGDGAYGTDTDADSVNRRGLLMRQLILTPEVMVAAV
jgi:hypothetical protein